MTTKEAVQKHRERARKQCATVEKLASAVERANGMDEAWVERIRRMRARVEAVHSELKSRDPHPDKPGGDGFPTEEA